MYETVKGYCFSPTGGTKKVTGCLVKALSPEGTVEDLSAREFPEQTVETDTLAVFAIPVFAGRVPQPALAAIRKVKGQDTPAIAVAVYGNREFDDALLELSDCLTELGFRVIGAGAFVAEHSMLRTVAAGRPDEQDLSDLDRFAQGIRQKLQTADLSQVTVPGNRPYCNMAALPFKPSASGDCTGCGLCAKQCPVQAIPSESPNTTQKGCILCMRCVAACPVKARSLPFYARAGIKLKLGKLESVRKENQTWL